MCNKQDLFLSFELMPWVCGLQRISEMCGISPEYIKILYWTKKFPLRIGPRNEYRCHSKEVWRWLAGRADENWTPDKRNRPQLHIRKEVSQRAKPHLVALGENELVGRKRFFISGWRDIATYIGFKRTITAQKYHRNYRMPLFYLEEHSKRNVPRMIPQLVDLWFYATDYRMRQERRRYWQEKERERKRAAGSGGAQRRFRSPGS